MNLPCIVSNINGCNEIIKNMINGILISKKDVGELKKAMLKISKDDDLRDKLSKNSRQIISVSYTHLTLPTKA